MSLTFLGCDWELDCENFEHSNIYSKHEFVVSFSNSSFGEIFYIKFLFRFIQIQMNFAFGSLHVRFFGEEGMNPKIGGHPPTARAFLAGSCLRCTG